MKTTTDAARSLAEREAPYAAAAERIIARAIVDFSYLHKIIARMRKAESYDVTRCRSFGIRFVAAPLAEVPTLSDEYSALLLSCLRRNRRMLTLMTTVRVALRRLNLKIGSGQVDGAVGIEPMRVLDEQIRKHRALTEASGHYTREIARHVSRRQAECLDAFQAAGYARRGTFSA